MEVAKKGLVGRVIFTSFDMRVLKMIKELEPQASVGLITMFFPGIAERRAEKAGFKTIAIEKDITFARTVRRAHEAGMRVFAWSPSKPDEIEALFRDKHVDAVIANNIHYGLEEKAALGF